MFKTPESSKWAKKKILYKMWKALLSKKDCPNTKAWCSWGLCSDCKRKNLDRIAKIKNFSLILIDQFCYSIKTKKFPKKIKRSLPASLKKCLPKIQEALMEFSKKLYKSEEGLKERYPNYEKICGSYKNYEEIWKKYEKNIFSLIHNHLFEFSDYEFIG